MIRVLHVVLSLETGGLENGVVNLLNYADTQAFHVDVLCLRARGALAERVIDQQQRVLFSEPAVSVSAAIRRIYQICRTGNYQIVHTHGWATLLAGFVAAKLAGVRVIINGEHGVLYDHTWQQRCAQRWLFAAVTLNLSVCADLVQQISRRFKVDPRLFHVILNGVDTEKFAPNTQVRQVQRQKLGITDATTLIGSVGRLVPIKNYALLLRAVAQVIKSGHTVALVLVGEGSERAGLESLAAQLGIVQQIHFVGQQNAIADYLQMMDLFVLPSFNEGLSNTLLEAMACGVPVVASQVGGNPEVVNACTGALFASDNLVALTDILLDWVKRPHLRSQLAMSAREYCLTQHSIGAMVRAYEQTYREYIE